MGCLMESLTGPPVGFEIPVQGGHDVFLVEFSEPGWVGICQGHWRVIVPFYKGFQSLGFLGQFETRGQVTFLHGTERCSQIPDITTEQEGGFRQDWFASQQG